jgi:hypothetical protein
MSRREPKIDSLRSLTDTQLQAWMLQNGFLIDELDCEDDEPGYISFVRPDGQREGSPCFLGPPATNHLLRYWWIRAYLEGYQYGKEAKDE